MLFMFGTTLTASYELVGRFWRQGGVTPTLDAILVAVMAILAIVVLVDSLLRWHKQLTENALSDLEAEAAAE